MKTLSDSIRIDDRNDVIVIDGVTITGDLLRQFTQPSAPGEWFRIVKREDGVVTVHVKHEDA